MRKPSILAISVLFVGSAACARPANAPAAPHKEVTAVNPSSAGAPLSGLPFAQGRSFSTLDEYLAFRKERGAYDVPWYKEVSPGVYELVTRRVPGKPFETFTREQLMEKFGFSR